MRHDRLEKMPSENDLGMSGYRRSLSEAQRVLESLAGLEAEIERAGEWCADAIAAGGKLLLCGNGGSSCEAQHLAGELMGRYRHSRPSLPAIALTADPAVLTCIANDYGFEELFERQLRALGRKGDVLIAFTSSGNSANILAALRAAKEMEIRSIAFLGSDGGKAKDLADCPLLVSHSDTARAQEGHQFLMHSLMDVIEARFVGGRP